VAREAPNFDVAYLRLGLCLIQQGKRQEGLSMSEKAVRIPRSGIEAQRPLTNSYDSSIESNASIEKAFDKIVNYETGEDDSYPSAKDRFRLIATLKDQTSAQCQGEVWILFKDREGVTREIDGPDGKT
jgi:hypothetical protein